MYTLPSFIQYSVPSLIQSNQKRERYKSGNNRKERGLYLKDPIESTQKLVDPINNYSKIKRLKINIKNQSSIYFY